MGKSIIFNSNLTPLDQILEYILSLSPGLKMSVLLLGMLSVLQRGKYSDFSILIKT